MNGPMMSMWKVALVVMGTIGLLNTPVIAQAAKPELKGKFEILKDEPSTHQPGKVKVVEFADFYIFRIAHHFEETGVPLLLKEFGTKVDITMVGFPVIPGKLPTVFDMYEQAKLMGKGDQMRTILFRTIHKDKVDGVFDRSIRSLLIKEAGLDVRGVRVRRGEWKAGQAIRRRASLGRTD